jgi:hypothetical protein
MSIHGSPFLFIPDEFKIANLSLRLVYFRHGNCGMKGTLQL